ncbi:hypothetical protein GCM10010429_46110 [Micromonospora olivasterospora]
MTGLLGLAGQSGSRRWPSNRRSFEPSSFGARDAGGGPSVRGRCRRRLDAGKSTDEATFYVNPPVYSQPVSRETAVMEVSQQLKSGAEHGWPLRLRLGRGVGKPEAVPSIVGVRQWPKGSTGI